MKGGAEITTEGPANARRHRTRASLSGLKVRATQAFLAEADTVEVSADFISTVTDAVLAEVTEWQTRPREPM